MPLYQSNIHTKHHRSLRWLQNKIFTENAILPTKSRLSTRVQSLIAAITKGMITKEIIIMIRRGSAAPGHLLRTPPRVQSAIVAMTMKRITAISQRGDIPERLQRPRSPSPNPTEGSVISLLASPSEGEYYRVFGTSSSVTFRAFLDSIYEV